MSDAVTVRQGVATDVQAIRSLTRDAYAKWVPVIGREPKPMAADYAEAIRHHRFDLLYVGPILAALIETIPAVDHLLVENLAVAPRFQGCGHGSELMALAEELAALSGLQEIRLYTNKLFAANIRLYTKLGYRINREEDTPRGIAVHMSKLLQSHCDIA